MSWPQWPTPDFPLVAAVTGLVQGTARSVMSAVTISRRAHAAPLAVVETRVDTAHGCQGDAGADGGPRALGIALVVVEGRSAGVAKRRGGLRHDEDPRLAGPAAMAMV